MSVGPFTKLLVARSRAFSKGVRLCALLFFCLCGIQHTHAAATLLLEEPYSYDGAFAGTGHVAVYLSRVCSVSPVILRPCAEDESGVVLSRYDGIAGYDWIAIPLIPYLYAVDRPEAIPLFADPRLVAFLRDQYRREHLESLAPDRPGGGAPEGNWYELIGASYDRTIYGFEIETSPEQDARLISKFNSQPNRQRYNFVKRNCADFVREVINFYYPHALHRSVIGDLGVTTPKQIAKMLVKYCRHHPELQSADFLVPQVPGAVPRSKPVHGVLESVVAAKKYMLPLIALHPYIGGSLLVEYFGHRRFDPAGNALILDSWRELESPMTRDDRLAYQSRMDELMEVSFDSLGKGIEAQGRKSEGKTEEKSWERLQASAQPGFDVSGKPVLHMPTDGDVTTDVGLSRSNIVSVSGSPELAARLLAARINQELRPSAARKTAPGDVNRDLVLYLQLLSLQREEIASFTHNSRAQAGAGLQ